MSLSNLAEVYYPKEIVFSGKRSSKPFELLDENCLLCTISILDWKLCVQWEKITEKIKTKCSTCLPIIRSCIRSTFDVLSMRSLPLVSLLSILIPWSIQRWSSVLAIRHYVETRNSYLNKLCSRVLVLVSLYAAKTLPERQRYSSHNHVSRSWNREILSFSTELRRISSLTYTKVIIGEHGCEARKIEKTKLNLKAI
jgi:hypothetical protein